MSNIVERLRDTAQHCSSWGIDLATPPFNDWADLMDDAAEEIERLRKIIAAAYYADTDSAVALLEEEVRR